jgi:hypothetical protein
MLVRFSGTTSVLDQLSVVSDMLQLVMLAASDLATRTEGAALVRVTFDAMGTLQEARHRLTEIKLYDPRLQ